MLLIMIALDVLVVTPYLSLARSRQLAVLSSGLGGIIWHWGLSAILITLVKMLKHPRDETILLCKVVELGMDTSK